VTSTLRPALVLALASYLAVAGAGAVVLALAAPDASAVLVPLWLTAALGAGAVVKIDRAAKVAEETHANVARLANGELTARIRTVVREEVRGEVRSVVGQELARFATAQQEGHTYHAPAARATG
jgi:hypothetical protein